jgi:hypothetical protein
VTHKKVKGLKPWLFKSVAVFIGICYLMVPLQHEITEVMHFLSHSLDEASGQHIMASHTHNFNDHHNQDNYKAGNYFNETVAHIHSEEGLSDGNDHDHSHTSDMHQHEIIDFMNMAFSTSSTNHEDNDKIAVQSDLDKHLVLKAYLHPKPVTVFKKQYFSNIKQNTSKGIEYPLVPPPKSLS